MKVSLNWLNEFVPLPSTAELTELVTLAGVEVEDVQTRGVLVDNVVVAQILESVQHPNADRLSVCKVDDGSGQIRQIVCGAKNYKVGDKVPLALPGAVMPGEGGGFKIKVGKLRGVESQGMMCSAKELGLAEDADGLLILPPSSQLGTALAQLFPAETVLDLEVTPNRPDLLSHMGMAREIGALIGKQPCIKEVAAPAASTHAEVPKVPKVTLEAPEAAPFYSARRISGVKVGPSPAWLRQRLETIGLRSINNVVDVTNFVMMERGQPLHAFDAAKVSGAIVVRLAKEGEELAALDERGYRLAAKDLVIADESRALAIAGVMGGKSSGVTEATTEVILESAYFQSSGIRRTARHLGISSDSGYRFERGVDPETVIPALNRAAALIAELCGASAISEIGSAGELPNLRRTVPLRSGRAAAVLGADIPEARVDSILTGFGLTKVDQGWAVPSFRQDLVREIDLIEEVARVFGIENIPSRESGRFAPVSGPDRDFDRDTRLRKLLVNQGFFEARTLTLVSEKAGADDFFADGEARRVRNPLNEDQVLLRANLTPGLLGVVAHNVRHGNRNLRLFEIGRVFRSDEREERTHLGLLLTGEVQSVSWNRKEARALDLFDLKGILAAFGWGEVTFEKKECPGLALAFSILADGKCIGSGGQLWPAQARTLDVNAPVIVAEIDPGMLETAERKPVYQGIPRFPAVTRDIALIAPENVQHEQIVNVITSAKEPLLGGVELFDLFVDPSGEKIAAGARSLAYSLTYRANDRTLTVEEVNAAHARLKECLKAQLPLSFRE